MNAVQCVARVHGGLGGKRRCPNAATTERNGWQVCGEHVEPVTEKSK